MASIADLFLKLVVDDTGFAKDVQVSAQKAGDAGGKTLSERLSGGLKVASVAVGAGLGAAFGGAVQLGAEFEDQLRTINTVAKLSDEQLHAVGNQILEVSRQTGKSTAELTSGFYDLVSAGVPADKAIKVLKDSAVLATGALSTTGEAVDLLTSTLNAYKMGAEESTRVSDIWAKTVADGKVTAAELAGSIANIAPIAAAAGVKVEEVAAGFALMTAQGTPAAQAATQMRSAISALLTPNIQLNAIQKETNQNFTEMAKEKGLAVTLEAIRVATHGDGAAFAKALGSVEAYQYALSVTGENAAGAAIELGKIEGVAATGGEAMGQFAERMKSPIEQGKLMAAQFKTALISVGQSLQEFGPLVTVFGPVFGTALSTAVGAGFGALVSSQKVATAVKGAAIALGLAWEGALFLSSRVVNAALGIFQALGSAGGPVVAGSTTAGAVAGAAFQAAFVLGLAALGAIVADKVQHIGEDTIGNILGGKFRTPTQEMNQAVEELASKLGISFDQAMAQVIAEGQRTGNGSIPDAIASLLASAEPKVALQGDVTGRAYMTAEADAINGGGGAVTAAMADINAMISRGATVSQKSVADAFHRGSQIMINSVAHATELVTADFATIVSALAGLVGSADDDWKAWASASKGPTEDVHKRINILTKRIEKLDNVDLAKLGPAALAAWAKAKNSTQTELTGLTEFVQHKGDIIAKVLPNSLHDSNQAAIRQWVLILNNAHSYGNRTGEAWSSGFSKIIGNVTSIMNHVRDIVRAESPPGPKSPLHHIRRWGLHTGDEYSSGMLESISRLPARMAGALSGLDSSMGLSMPTLALNGSMGLGAMSGVSAGSSSINHTGTILHDLTPRAAQALRDVGYNEQEVARNFVLAARMPVRR